MKHTNKIAIEILTDEYADYPKNDLHYDREYKMIVKGYEKGSEDTAKAAVDHFMKRLNK